MGGCVFGGFSCGAGPGWGGAARQEEKFATIQEQVAAHTKKIKKLWSKFEEVGA